VSRAVSELVHQKISVLSSIDPPGRRWLSSSPMTYASCVLNQVLISVISFSALRARDRGAYFCDRAAESHAAGAHREPEEVGHGVRSHAAPHHHVQIHFAPSGMFEFPRSKLGRLAGWGRAAACGCAATAGSRQRIEVMCYPGAPCPRYRPRPPALEAIGDQSRMLFAGAQIVGSHRVFGHAGPL